MRGPCLETAARLFVNLSPVSHLEPFSVGIVFLGVYILYTSIPLQDIVLLSMLLIKVLSSKSKDKTFVQ